MNFPVLVNLASDTELAASAQTTGGDIYFTSASGAKLAHEIERFQKATGGLAAWVNIPALSSTTDTVIYMYFGNASAADQQNRTAVWDSGYSAVWHMREGSAQHVDSTANANQSQTVSVAASGGTAGQIGMADQFSRAQLSHITIPGSTSLRQPTLTVEAWVKANSAVSGAQDVISFGDDVTLRIEWNGAASFYVYDGGYRWMTGTADLRGGKPPHRRGHRRDSENAHDLRGWYRSRLGSFELACIRSRRECRDRHECLSQHRVQLRRQHRRGAGVENGPLGGLDQNRIYQPILDCFLLHGRSS